MKRILWSKWLWIAGGAGMVGVSIAVLSVPAFGGMGVLGAGVGLIGWKLATDRRRAIPADAILTRRQAERDRDLRR